MSNVRNDWPVGNALCFDFFEHSAAAWLLQDVDESPLPPNPLMQGGKGASRIFLRLTWVCEI